MRSAPLLLSLALALAVALLLVALVSGPASTALVAGVAAAFSTASASHILVSTEKQANELKDKIVNEGADFAELARQHSSCPSKARGGSLGQFKPGASQLQANEERD